MVLSAELILLDYLGIEVVIQEPRLWDGISERVYGGDLDAAEAYSEYHLILDRWQQK